MFYNNATTFTYDSFKDLLQNEDYDKLINDCYYSSNQEDILLYLEKNLFLNNFIINYIYVRNSYQLGKFKDPDIIRKCLSISLRTIFIVVAHINICNEINRKFDVLDILIKKIEEKFKNYITIDILDFCINLSKKEILTFIDTMSSNISLPGSPLFNNQHKKMLDLPDPQLICNITAGPWRYPAMKYTKFSDEIEIENSNKFIKNYSARCQKYYDAYQYVGEKLKLVRNDFETNSNFNLCKYFL